MVIDDELLLVGSANLNDRSSRSTRCSPSTSVYTGGATREMREHHGMNEAIGVLLKRSARRVDRSGETGRA